MNSRGIAALGALLIAFVHAIFFTSPTGQTVEYWGSDIWFSLRGVERSPSDLVIVSIDEASYRALEVPLNGAWPRELHARLLERLRELGARRVVFDVLFLDEGIPAADRALADALSKIPSVVGAELSARTITAGSGSIVLEELLSPPPLIATQASLGLIGLALDNGRIRGFFTPRSAQFSNIPSLAEAAAALPINAPRPGPHDLIRYYGPPGTIPSLSYYQVMETEHPIPVSFIRDKIVVVGLLMRSATGPSQKDSFPSPFPPYPMFGTEIHATATGNLLEGRWIHRYPLGIEQAALGVTTFLISFLLLLWSPLRGGLLLITFSIAWAAVASTCFFADRFVPGANLVLFILPCSYFANTVAQYIRSRGEHKITRTMFSHYLSPGMVDEVLRNPDAAKVGGRKVWATAMFTDIAGFTGITEEMPAEEVSAMLNAYFAVAGDAILANQGALIKFIGDAIYALFGAPISLNDHARLAVTCALEIERVVELFNREGRFPPLITRIGIHTGPMVVGNLGSPRRFDFTAIGDSVNLASRTEGLNKYFGTTILFTEATRRELGGAFPGPLPVAHVRVAGKREIIPFYTIFREGLDPATEQMWLSALEAFKLRSWETARSLFAEVGTAFPRLGIASALYVDATNSHEREPPGIGWAGEITFDSK